MAPRAGNGSVGAAAPFLDRYWRRHHRWHVFPGRPWRVHVRFADDEYAELTIAADQVGLTPTGFCAQAALDAARGRHDHTTTEQAELHVFRPPQPEKPCPPSRSQRSADPEIVMSVDMVPCSWQATNSSDAGVAKQSNGRWVQEPAPFVWRSRRPGINDQSGSMGKHATRALRPARPRLPPYRCLPGSHPDGRAYEYVGLPVQPDHPPPPWQPARRRFRVGVTLTAIRTTSETATRARPRGGSFGGRVRDSIPVTARDDWERRCHVR